MSADVAGGVSAAREAQLARLKIESFQRQLAEEHRRLETFSLASRTERRIAALLSAMQPWGWHLLADRRWPGTRGANIDLIHVGPGGVLVIDVKAWKEPRVEHDMLWNGDADASDDVEALIRVTALVEESVQQLGLAPLEVTPVLVLAGRTGPELALGRVQLLGERRLVAWANRRGARLSEQQVTVVAGQLAETFPPYEAPLPVRVSTAVPAPVVPRAVTQDDELSLFDVAAIEASLVDAALLAPIEEWMTFLHPEQVRLVRRSFNGPARVRGPAGTGKTVVGLHRAAYLAATRTGPILYTAYVRTLPAVLGSLYARLSPTTVDRVEFTGIFALALRLLHERGVRVRLDGDRARLLFNRAWVSTGRRTCLADVAVHPDYWWDEVSGVIKGRALTEFEEYAGLQRVGRRLPLLPPQRAAVWDLYTAYDGLLRADGVCDFADVLALALAEVSREPLHPAYAAVVVDEVQDLTCVGVRFLHALVGDRSDGLLLIGDGQQAVYPGGFTLAEAGVSIAGRGTRLTTNYRNAAEILDVAAAVVAADSYDDLEGVVELGKREMTVARSGGRTARVDARDERSHDAALLTHLRELASEPGVSFGDCAVLASTRAVARRYARLLAAAGVPVVDLEDYDGTKSHRVKVGTFKRAKGLEFKHVFLPMLSAAEPSQRAGEADPAYVERVELERRELYVGMTRARDGLWLGYLTPSSSAPDA